MPPNGHRSVTIRGEEFKFSCAHFVSHKTFRERLHGHNYTVEAEVSGSMCDEDGYVIDFGILKAGIRSICKSWNEKILVPAESPCMEVKVVDLAGNGGVTGPVFTACGSGDIDISSASSMQVEIRCLSSFFSFPRDDCELLPIRFSTAEELSKLFAVQLSESMRTEFRTRGISSVTVRVFERPTQCASYTLHLD